MLLPQSVRCRDRLSSTVSNLSRNGSSAGLSGAPLQSMAHVWRRNQHSSLSGGKNENNKTLSAEVLSDTKHSFTPLLKFTQSNLPRSSSPSKLSSTLFHHLLNHGPPSSAFRTRLPGEDGEPTIHIQV